jgi:sugar/nucleoside kinase (ribokinase family)
MSKKTIDVTGIGNAIMDIIAQVDDNLLAAFSLEKGSMKLICEQEAGELHSRINIKTMVSGGSAANTIAGLALLGDKTAFIGKVKDDRLGYEFEQDLKKLGVIYKTEKATGDCPSTANCIVLTTPDTQRTMNTFLGISCMLSERDVDENLIEKSKIVYLEGYLFDQPAATDAVLKTIKLSKTYKTLVAISLSDMFCVKRNIGMFENLIFGNSVDICFGNETEINELCRTSKAEEAFEKLKKYDILFIITRGKDGSSIIRGNTEIHIDAEKVSSIDSTGAGDMYAAGFLHGLIRGKSICESAKTGSVAAGHIVCQYGARPLNSLSEILSEKGLN